MDLIRELFRSKKFIACLLFIILLPFSYGVVQGVLGIPVTEDMVWQWATVVSAYLAGQGLADLGKEGKKLDALREKGLVTSPARDDE